MELKKSPSSLDQEGLCKGLITSLWVLCPLITLIYTNSKIFYIV
ncbi:MAG: hypothetical protein R6T98_05120 [Desulfatiglandales bacterium]